MIKDFACGMEGGDSGDAVVVFSSKVVEVGFTSRSARFCGVEGHVEAFRWVNCRLEIAQEVYFCACVLLGEAVQRFSDCDSEDEGILSVGVVDADLVSVGSDEDMMLGFREF